MDELMNLLSTGGEAIDPDGVAANEEDSSAPIISVENCSDDEGGNQSSSSKHWKELLLLQQQQQRRQNVIEMVLRSWVSSLEPEKGPLQMLIDEPGSPAEGATAPSSAPSFAAVGTASTASAGCPCAFMAGGSPDVAMDPHAMFKGFSEQFKLDRENSLKRLKEMLLWASTVPPEMFADHDFMDLNEPL